MRQEKQFSHDDHDDEDNDDDDDDDDDDDYHDDDFGKSREELVIAIQGDDSGVYCGILHDHDEKY